MMFPGWANVRTCKRGNICCGHKMFLKKIRNIFCVSDTNFVSATSVARVGKRGNICVCNNVSATLCPLIAQQWALHVTLTFRCTVLSSSATQRCEINIFFIKYLLLGKMNTLFKNDRNTEQLLILRVTNDFFKN